MNQTNMRILLQILVLLSLLTVVPTIAHSQTISSLTAKAEGQGTIKTADIDSHQITSILVILREDGTAQLTFYSDLQLFAEGAWKQNKVTNQQIDLKISGGIVSGNATGVGKLVLHQDGKSIKKLTIRAKSAGGVVSVDFVANPPAKKAVAANGGE